MFTVDIRIFDILGKEVLQQNRQLPAGNHVLTFEVQAFEPGMYFMEIEDGEKTVIEKFVKQ